MIKNIYKQILIPVLLILIWQTGSELSWFNSYLLPAPSAVLSAFFKMCFNGQLLKHIMISFYRVFTGFILAVFVSFGGVLIFYFYPQLYTYSKLILEFLRHIPPLAVISLLILWFGIGETSKIVVVFLVSFLPVFFTTLNSITYCDPKLIEVGKSINMSNSEILKRIIIPSVLPSIIMGLQLGLTYAWRSLIGAEMIAASAGLGYMILNARELSQSSVIIVGIFSLGLIGTAIDKLFSWLLGLLPHGVPQDTKYAEYRSY